MARKVDMVARGGDYNVPQGTKRIKGSNPAAKQVKKSKMRTTLAGWMDSRPENSDRNQSAR